MKHQFILQASCAFFVLMSVVRGQNIINDPIQDYLAATDPVKENSFFAFRQLNVLDLDLNGDGKNEKLISFNGTTGKIGLSWDVYQPSGPGFTKVETAGEPLIFSPLLFYVGQISELNDYGLLVKVPKGDLEFYKLIGNQIIKQETPSLKFTDAIWKKYFAGPSEDKPHRAQEDHPMLELTKEELKAKGYDLSRIDNARQPRNPLKVMEEKPSEAAPSVQQSPQKIESSKPKPFAAAPVVLATTKSAFSSTNWLMVVLVILIVVLAGAVAWKYLRKQP